MHLDTCFRDFRNGKCAKAQLEGRSRHGRQLVGDLSLPASIVEYNFYVYNTITSTSFCMCPRPLA